MIGLLLDCLYLVGFACAGLATVRVAGIALNARDRRRHARCLKNIERLEILNGYREDTKAVRYREFLSAGIFEIKPGAPQPVFFPAPRRYPLLDDLVAQQQAAQVQQTQQAVGDLSTALQAILAKYDTGSTHG